jgi:hypothetical protein
LPALALLCPVRKGQGWEGRSIDRPDNFRFVP